MNEIDNLTQALKSAKKTLTNATDDYESAERLYYEDPCKSTEARLKKAQRKLTEASDAYDELCTEPLPWS